MIRRSSTADGRSIRTLHINWRDRAGERWQKSVVHQEGTQGKHETSATRHRTTGSGPVEALCLRPGRVRFKRIPRWQTTDLCEQNGSVNLTTGRRVQLGGA